MKIPRIKALVPMKAHSERVPGKNIKDLCKKPAFFWIIESLEKCKYIDEIIINTDSGDIAQLARKFELVTILERPDHLLGDHVGIQPLIEYDLANSQGEFYLQTHSTNPLVSPQTLEKAIEAFFAQKKHDALFSVTPIQSRFYWKDGKAINHDPDNLIRTQDLDPVYEENSCFYIFSKQTNKKTRNRLGKTPMMHPIHPLEAVDIDNMEDFYWAEFLLNKKLQSSE
jgi:CMP-N-acetylneuraminic acid synthetase